MSHQTWCDWIYTVHTPTHICQQFQGASPVAVNTLAFGGVASFKFNSFEKYLAAFADPYYVNVIAPDEQKFLGKIFKEAATVIMGIEHQIVTEGNSLVNSDKEMALWEKWQKEINNP
ncbi:hypothetical protein F5884DRAFT_905331 [Xylogone sp. PMI_703]|nr:hypothetical protein F5884DRAFT_905331 [Xylogone sp. PMI_703]